MYFNVQTYGAVPNNGSYSAANVSAINAAIAALIANGGGTLYFPAGIWYVNSALTTITVSCTVLGDGSGCTQIQQSASVPVLNFQTLGIFVVVHGLTINGPGAQCVLLGASANGLDSRIEDCAFFGATTGVEVWGQNQTVIRDCVMGSGISYGVYFKYGCGLVTGCQMHCGVAGVWSAVAGLMVMDNYIGVGGQYGIVQVVAAGADTDLWVEGNHIEGQSVAGVSLQGSTTFSAIHIVGNEFAYESTSPSGMNCIDTSGVSGSLSLLTITGNSFQHGNGYGIKLYNATIVSIAGNVFHGDNASGTAICIDSSCSNGKMVGNTFSGSGTYLTNNGGFYVEGELITASLGSGSAIGLSTNTRTTIVSVSVPAGEWDLQGIACFNLSSASVGILECYVSTTNNDYDLGDFSGQCQIMNLTGSVEHPRVMTPLVRVTFTSTKTVYLVADAEIFNGSVTAYGQVNARRVQT